MLEFVQFKNTVSAQTQGRGLFWFNYKFYHMGIVIPYTAIPNTTKAKENIIFSLFPVLSIGISNGQKTK